MKDWAEGRIIPSGESVRLDITVIYDGSMKV